jgi:predicted outer membrane repeat protein
MSNEMKMFFALLITLGAFLPNALAIRYFVANAAGNDANNGKSWATAFRSFQKALDVARDGDEVWLTSGIYRPTKDYSGQSYPNAIKIRESFYIKYAIKVYGGFIGNETATTQRSPLTTPTYLSGDIDGDDLANPAQSPADIVGDNSYVPVEVYTSPNQGILTFDGLTITAGGGEGGMQVIDGGSTTSITNCRFTGNFGNSSSNETCSALGLYGVSGTGCNATIDHCTFDHNVNGSGPAASQVWAQQRQVTATFTYCTFSDNSGLYGGAASMFGANGLPCISNMTNCSFTHNTATGAYGGAISISAARLSCSKCSFQENQAYLGGAIYASYLTNLDNVFLLDNSFVQNTAIQGGGAIYAQTANLTIARCDFQFNNTTNGDGGAILFDQYLAPLTDQTMMSISQSFFNVNRCTNDGGAICHRDPYGSTSITGTRFYGNYAMDGGALYMGYDADATGSKSIYNNLFAGNEGAFGHGAAIYLRQAPGTTHLGLSSISQSAFYQNYANIAGNDVFADNTAFNGSRLVSWGSITAFGEYGTANNGKINLYNSLVQSPNNTAAGINGSSVENIFNQNPLFIDAANRNFHVQMCSPAVNTGGATTGVSGDYDGNTRPYNDGTGRYDMGAFEFQGTPPNTFYVDRDGDGYGITTEPILKACQAPPGFAALKGDCNDADASINPGAVEICDGKDNNCNGLVDYLDPTYVDHEPPVFSAAVQNYTLTCADPVPPVPVVTATDNCSPTVTVVFAQTSTRSSDPGQCAYYSYTITRKWTAADLKGNAAQMTQTITVKDDQAPVLHNIPASLTVECTPPQPAYVTASDNCAAGVAVQYQEVRTNGACPQTYTLTRTWKAADPCGNATSAVQVIEVQDTKPPFVLFPPEQVVFVECDQAIPQITFLQSQDCDPNPILTVDEQTEDFDADPYNHIFHRITRHIALTDHCGNATTFTQIVNIRDTHPPVIGNCPENMTVQGTEAGADVSYPDPNIKDNCGADVYFTPYGPGGHFPVGTTQVYIDAYDKGDNYADCSFTITVVDQFRVHCQEDIFATVLKGAAFHTNEVRWNLPSAQPCPFCDTQENQPDFTQMFRFLGTLEGHRYYLSKQKTDFATAELASLEYHGYPVSIDAKTEQTFLKNELAGLPVFLGLSDAAQEGTFVWMDGLNSTYTNWAPGNPATGAAGNNRDQVILGADGRWLNVLNTDSAYFVLEVPCLRVLEQATTVPANHQLGFGNFTTKYLIQDICGQKDTCLQRINVSHDVHAYCMPNFTPSGLDQDTSYWIQSVRIGAFTENTGNNSGYYRHTGLTTTLKTSQAYPLQVKVQSHRPGPVNAYIRVWADFNADRDFYDSGELLLDTFSVSGDILTVINIPADAKTGDLRQRIRVAVSKYAAPEACGDYVIGETEDYRIAIAAPSFDNAPSADRNETVIASAQVSLYPNPASRLTWLDLSELGDVPCTVRVLNLTGQLLRTIPVAQANAEVQRIDVHTYTSGMYFVQVLDRDGRLVRTEKLVVEQE